jgi:penicillin amidase
MTAARGQAGVRRVAAEQYAQASLDSRAALTAYAAGINAYVQNELSARPPEFMLLGVQPEPWTPEDSMAWATMMAWDLGSNWSAELLRLRMSLKFPVDRVNELLPPYPGDKPLPTADYAALFRGLKLSATTGQQALNAAPESGVEGIGSNNWVVHGSHTESGKPLLANDPHLKLTAPALWYLARLEAPGFKVAGATMPGLPFVVIGQNEHLAWGLTNTAPDVQDLYLERIKPDVFGPLRGLTMLGMFTHPEHGGNFNKIGWRLIGYVDQYSWVPPFGYYDRGVT